jgi:hypothetical protein
VKQQVTSFAIVIFLFLFFHFLNHLPLFCRNFMKVAKVGENMGFWNCGDY